MAHPKLTREQFTSAARVVKIYDKQEKVYKFYVEAGAVFLKTSASTVFVESEDESLLMDALYDQYQDFWDNTEGNTKKE